MPHKNKQKINTYMAHYRSEDGTVQDVWDHLLNVGERSEKIASKFGLASAGRICGLLHDLGKATQAFNAYIRKSEGLETFYELPANCKIDHSTAGSQWLYQKMVINSQNLLSPTMLPLVVASHHSELNDCLDPCGESPFLRRMNKNHTETRLDEVVENMPDWFLQELNGCFDEEKLEKSLQKLLALAKEEIDCRQESYFKLGLLTRFLFSAVIDADRTDTIDFMNPNHAIQRPDGHYISWKTLIDRIESKISSFEAISKIDEQRQQVSNNCLERAAMNKGVFRLSVPTGGGKTLASLRFALHHAEKHRMDHVFYIIPYTSIIDQNAKTIRDILEKEGEEGQIVLEHHSNLHPDSSESDEYQLLSQNWDAPIVMTTMVQLLETLFGSGTSSVRRLHQLANSVIIFDEIQTLPIRCVHMFNVAMRFLIKGCGASLVLCTATQPLLDQVEPASRALPSKEISEITGDVKKLYKEFKRCTVEHIESAGGVQHDILAEKVVEEVEEGQSVLIIMNTKKDASLLFNEIKSMTTGIPLFHLSTSMCPAHRMESLKNLRELLEIGTPVICVSTQLIEAGVDVDFHVVFRALAGLDSIQQAAGRCNRHGKRSTGRVYLFELTDENLKHLKDIQKGKEITKRVLGEYEDDRAFFDYDILGTEAMNRYYQYYFFQRQEEMSYLLNGQEDTLKNRTLYELLSSNYNAREAYKRKNGEYSELFLEQSFQTAAKAFHAIDRKTQGVIVPYGEEGEKIIQELCALKTWEYPYEWIKRAQQYSVNCYVHELNRLNQQGTVFETQKGSGIYYLDSRNYSSEKGLVIGDSEKILETLVT
ncbi:CRISPR-associated helicase/endonuclease Cas3 [Tindallia californiensis]|uniref:CRISPR-associated helicase, Cas3 family n=1 Tax=Tindallia californiensis TaxID=159292 RepID=A0A1H3RBC3_9FIRM|nr:CRISPR-associated helicase/endonuclease Cas3 [Tindallia californiensis]SDZ22538.1 CRISPR-associated helicase, Cas3 family [Tindallia californiensis]